MGGKPIENSVDYGTGTGTDDENELWERYFQQSGPVHAGRSGGYKACAILDELHQYYIEMCELTGRKAHRLAGAGNGLRKNPLMQKLAEEMFGLRIEIPPYEEEAACGAVRCMKSLCDKSFLF